MTFGHKSCARQYPALSPEAPLWSYRPEVALQNLFLRPSLPLWPHFRAEGFLAAPACPRPADFARVVRLLSRASEYGGRLAWEVQVSGRSASRGDAPNGGCAQASEPRDRP